MSSSVSIPSEAQLRAESLSLPAGWVVGWSKSNGRRFYARPPTPTTKEIKQWEPPARTNETTPPAEQAHAATPAAALPPAKRNPSLPAGGALARPAAARLPVAAPPSPPPAASRSPTFLAAGVPLVPVFEAWLPPSQEAVQAEQVAAAEAARDMQQAAEKERAEAKMDLDEDEKERDRDAADAAESTSKKRRAGLGFGADDDHPAADDDAPPAQRRKAANGAMSFVTAGGAAANTPASMAALASDTPSTDDLATLPSDPRRLVSASRSQCTVNNPPVYASSYIALQALQRGPACPPSEWSDPAKYAEIVASTSVIVLNNVYGEGKCVTQARLREYLTPDTPLPPPPARHHIEEPPTLVNARRAAFNELDANLTKFVKEAGLREQPSMAFLRWGFNQRSLQDPQLVDQQDPLLPMDASVDACLTSELVRERLPKATAQEVCVKLAQACKAKAANLVKMKGRLAQIAAPPTGKFDLLLPHESHLHSFKAASAAAAAAAAASSASGGHLPASGRERDLSASNQSEREQYKIIYDLGGPSEHAIPLNHERFSRLKADYIRATGPVRGEVKEDTEFLRRLWTMCARYDTISGAGYQAALPEEGFLTLKKHWGVEYECYASPLNHCLDAFGSAFVETDRFFGSRGSFLDQRPLAGGFEANPPFLEEVMAPMAMHVLALMERAQAASQYNGSSRGCRRGAEACRESRG